MRIMALDISKNNIGIAISDRECNFVTYSNNLSRYSIEKIKEYITAIKPEYNIDLVLIGLPLNYETKVNNNFRYVKHIVHIMRNILKPYMFIDERMSTYMAKEMKIQTGSKKSIDELVAISFIERAIIAKDTIKQCIINKDLDHIL